jgi:glycosyltransferase involved in cell wall biosynthesis
MPKFYNKIDYLVLPSITEGFPNVILEAYACERRILSTPEAFPPELKTYGIVDSLNKWNKVIPALKELYIMNKNDFRDKEARNYVKNCYSWDIFSERMQRAFDYLTEII